MLTLLAVSCGGRPPRAAPSPSEAGRPPSAPRPPAGGTSGGPSPGQTSIASIPASLLRTQWDTVPTAQKVVALTFDAGADADGAPSILSTLASTGVPATFFMTGQWAESYPQYAAQIGAKYAVGNHTFSHPDLTKLTESGAREEIVKATGLIARATGQDPRPLFRFPFGAFNDQLIRLANSLGYGCIGWTVDTRGWMGTSGGQTVSSVIQRVMAAVQPGEIVIMHVGSNPTDHSTLDADALPQVISEIEARGYQFVTVPQYL